MLRWLATGAIAALLLLDLVLPGTSLGRRGAEAALRSEVPASRVEMDSPFPSADVVGLVDLDGTPFDVASLRGHRVLLTFERSVDW